MGAVKQNSLTYRTLGAAMAVVDSVGKYPHMTPERAVEIFAEYDRTSSIANLDSLTNRIDVAAKGAI